MRLILLTVLLPLFWECTRAGYSTNCQVGTITPTQWLLLGYTSEHDINDTHKGVVATFKTENVKDVEIYSTNYLDITFENEILTIFTTDEFKNFETEIRGKSEKRLEIKLKCHCTDNKNEVLTIYQNVIDINNHDPTFDREVYEYNFGMTIPEGFDLTQLQSISATDGDFTNDNIYFTIESDKLQDTFKLKKTGERKNWIYSTTLKVLKNITAPFKEEFNIVATDVGNPEISTKAKVILNVVSPKEDNSSCEKEEFIHPPVFFKNLYSANYTANNELKMEESIIIKSADPNNVIVQQNGYEEYFTLVQNPAVKENLELLVQTLKPLTKEILSKGYIVIEIKAESEGQSHYAVTSLLIQLPNETNGDNNLHPPIFSKNVYFANYTSNHTLKMEETIAIKYGATNTTVVRQSGYEKYIEIGLNPSNKTELQVTIIQSLNKTILENDLILIEIAAENEGLSIPGRTNLIINLPKELGSNSMECSVVHIWGTSFGDIVFSLILFLSAITIIVLLNVVVLSLYFKKQRANSLAAVNRNA